MILIAAADKNLGIGKDNSLLVSIPEDMRFFRETTSGNVVVMGRRTLESFPGGRPLKNRVNIVLTRNKDYENEGAVIVHTLDELKNVLEAHKDKDIYVIGGGSVYEQLLPLCDRAYITRIEKAFDADTYLPDIDGDPAWHIYEQSELFEHEGIPYRFVKYKRG